MTVRVSEHATRTETMTTIYVKCRHWQRKRVHRKIENIHCCHPSKLKKASRLVRDSDDRVSSSSQWKSGMGHRSFYQSLSPSISAPPVRLEYKDSGDLRPAHWSHHCPPHINVLGPIPQFPVVGNKSAVVGPGTEWELGLVCHPAENVDTLW